MCFSPGSSFTLAAVLLPAGIYCVSAARKADTRWLPLAIYPLAFSIQQAAEGFVWVGLNSGNQQLVDIAARVFLFFSHFFWMTFVPFSIWWLERNGPRKTALALLTWLGVIFGLSIFLPPAFMAGGLVVEKVVHSLEYVTVQYHDVYVDRSVLRVIYAAIVLVALFASREAVVKLFGVLILVSVLFTTYVFPYAFISVWCFLAAALSLHVTVVMALRQRSPRTAT